MHLAAGFPLDRMVRTHAYIDLRTPHQRDRGVKLATLAIEESELITRLHAQHLHMARSSSIQSNNCAEIQILRGENAWHGCLFCYK